jgi:hypothetical protein
MGFRASLNLQSRLQKRVLSLRDVVGVRMETLQKSGGEVLGVLGLRVVEVHS